MLQRSQYYPFGMQLDLPETGVLEEPGNLYLYNGKELNGDFGLDWMDYGARWYDAAVGRWNAVDPLAEKYYPYSAYNYVLNNPIRFIDPDGQMPIEPARNQAGTIQAAIQQWRDAGLNTITDIRSFVRIKNINGTEVAAIRYVYTNDYGWIDLSHYGAVHTYGKIPTDILEPLSGSEFLQDHLFGQDADRSFYSYEDLPSNQFAKDGESYVTELEMVYSYREKGKVPILKVKQGEGLFNGIENHFNSAGATIPQGAPNYRQIPLDDQDRNRLPRNATQEQLNSGDFVPQNRTTMPLDLNSFPAAPTSLERNEG